MGHRELSSPSSFQIVGALIKEKPFFFAGVRSTLSPGCWLNGPSLSLSDSFAPAAKYAGASLCSFPEGVEGREVKVGVVIPPPGLKADHWESS